MSELRNEFKQALRAQDEEQREEIRRMRKEFRSRIDKLERDMAKLSTAEVSYAAQVAGIRDIPFVPKGTRR
jgi:uncharacterized membrane protein